MISLDTNVLTRFIVKDDPKQLEKVIGLFYQLEQNNQQAFISMLVLIELNWVLSFSYNMTRDEIIKYFLKIINAPIFSVENETQVKHIVKNAKNNTFDLADLLIACRCEVEKNTPIMTFDKKASKFAWFELID